MIKKITIALLATFMLFLFLGCAQQPQPTITETPSEEAVTGQESIDEVGTGISDISDVEEDLDTSELDDLEDILSDIENI